MLMLCVLAGINKLSAQQLALKNGEVFTIETRNIAKAEFSSDEQYIFQYTVLNSNDTEYKLRCILLKARSQLNLPHKLIKVNSDSIRQTVFNSTAVLTPIILLEWPFTVVLSPKSKLIRFEGTDELIQQAIKRWHLTSGIQKYIIPNLNDFLSAAIKNMFFELPEKKISYQSTWTTGAKISYEVIAIRGALLDIVAASDDKTMHARYVLNEVTGLLADANVACQYNTGKALQHVDYSQTMVVNITTVVDTAWVNMAITMSDMSDAFKNKAGDLDSAKVFNYFKIHDELYKNDAYYVARKRYLKEKLRIYD